MQTLVAQIDTHGDTPSVQWLDLSRRQPAAAAADTWYRPYSTHPDGSTVAVLRRSQRLIIAKTADSGNDTLHCCDMIVHRIASSYERHPLK